MSRAADWAAWVCVIFFAIDLFILDWPTWAAVMAICAAANKFASRGIRKIYEESYYGEEKEEKGVLETNQNGQERQEMASEKDDQTQTSEEDKEKQAQKREINVC